MPGHGEKSNTWQYSTRKSKGKKPRIRLGVDNIKMDFKELI
jgi:hypothetical protein